LHRAAIPSEISGISGAISTLALMPLKIVISSGSLDLQ